MEEEKTKNTTYFPALVEEEDNEEEQEFSESDDSSTGSAKSEEWTAVSAEQQGLKSPRSVSKVKIKIFTCITHREKRVTRG